MWRMSYQEGHGMPPLTVTGRTGAWGRTKRRSGRSMWGTMDEKSWPLAPRPCSQMTAPVGLAGPKVSRLRAMGVSGLIKEGAEGA